MTESQDQLSARIIILNYKGKELLPKCLPSIVEAARKSSHPTQVSVLNNPADDDGLDYVEKNFPDVQIERSPVNRILCSYNDYVQNVSESVVILLNNDIRVDQNFIDPLIQKFKDNPKTFLVAPRVMTFDGEAIEAAKSKAGIRFGLFWCNARYPGYLQEAMTPSETFSSGFGAFSREKFIELGGYDDRYLPGIMEDVDLCYRARQKGYDLFYEPKSVLYHIGRASFQKAFGKSETDIVAHRNTFLFMWKNFSGFSFWMSHIFFLPLRLLFAVCRGNWAMIKGFFRAVQVVQR